MEAKNKANQWDVFISDPVPSLHCGIIAPSGLDFKGKTDFWHRANRQRGGACSNQPPQSTSLPPASLSVLHVLAYTIHF